ncbi:type I-E CRISPR-associated protein Cas6/Cse3/CasE [Lacticaseibacillus parakribbianus]|uniref:type I-E CRISPR-associated protein Cas6/Cse3/CasE n=1 Tax=Lacticaseibacillus parakribbianus TaxID=2970927 RepID=UPI0021CB83FA|nr:type I-E CRISPR-associated protein Cas6/Cse3/CasE [Lacticaseibacillus parakribbianus]
MFLSCVEVDWRDRQRLQTLTHLGAFHDWVEQSFPAAVAAGTRPRHLWRLDELAGHEYLLVLSAERPDPVGLARYGVAGSLEVKNYAPFLAQLQQGQQLRFRLTANPAHAVKDGTDPQARGKVYPHVTVAQQRQWLMDRAGAAGFALLAGTNGPQFDIVGRDHPVMRHKRRHAVRISRVTFEGRLEITDLEQFKTTLTTGLGREKAYGMGLMTVIPEVTE